MNTALSRLDRIENLLPDMLRRCARPLQPIDEADPPVDITAARPAGGDKQ